jgi:hypothetical protein
VWQRRRGKKFHLIHCDIWLPSSSPPSKALSISPLNRRCREGHKKETWVFKRQLSNFTYKQVTEGTAKTLSSETLSAETTRQRTKQLHIPMLSASYL